MPSALEKIVESFPHPTVSQIVGHPSYETIAELQLKLNTNAASIYSHLGNGRLGLLFLTVKPAVYNTQYTVTFYPPTNPGQTPTISTVSTGLKIAEIRRRHKDQFDEFQTYQQTDRTLKMILIASIDEAYIRSLRDKYIGYANVTTLQMLTHLYNSYARISQFDLKENYKRFKQQWDPNQPSEVLIDQIEDSFDYAAAGNTPYSKEQITNMAYNIIYRTGLFSNECKAWRKKDAPDQTWTTFKAEFTLAHQDLRESQVTVKNAGYHNQANFTQEDDIPDNAEALADISELANASTSDQNTIANAQLCKEIAATNTKLADALERL